MIFNSVGFCWFKRYCFYTLDNLAWKPTLSSEPATVRSQITFSPDSKISDFSDQFSYTRNNPHPKRKSCVEKFFFSLSRCKQVKNQPQPGETSQVGSEENRSNALSSRRSPKRANSIIAYKTQRNPSAPEDNRSETGDDVFTSNNLIPIERKSIESLQTYHLSTRDALEGTVELQQPVKIQDYLQLESQTRQV